MLDGKILRGETGTPMRRMARANNSFADADPEPLTLANLMTKSLTARMRVRVPEEVAARSGASMDAPWALRAVPPSGSEPAFGRPGGRLMPPPAVAADSRVPPASSRAKTFAYPMRRSGSVRHTGRNAGKRPRP